MGHREVKRVPMDFNAPRNKVWEGYINPHKGVFSCHPCNQSGYNQQTLQISEDWYDMDGDGLIEKRYEPVKLEIYDEACDKLRASGREMNWDYLLQGWQHNLTQDEVQALVDDHRLLDFTSTYSRETGWVRRADNYIPTADEVNLWSFFGFGHDSINRSICVKARATRLGVYGNCERCQGKGEIRNPNTEIYAAYEAWENYEPPQGEGWQLWETCSEGSPVTPVFKTAEKLAKYCETNVSIFASEYISYDQWLKMFVNDTTDVGSMMVLDSTGMHPMIETMDDTNE